MDKRRLIMVGGGSMAREIASWIAPTIDAQTTTFGGFIDDNEKALSPYPHYTPGMIGAIGSFVPRAGDRLVMGIAEPKTKLAVARQLLDRGGQFIEFIHPSALVSRHVQIGRGVVILPHAVVSCDAVIGDFAALNIGASVGHDVRLGAGCTLSAHVDITGFCEVGEGAFFGSHAVALPRSKVGAYSKVGAGTVVLKSVAEGASVMGVPAKQIFP